MSEMINQLTDALISANDDYAAAIDAGNAAAANKFAAQVNTLGGEITRLRALADPEGMAAEVDAMANGTARDVLMSAPSSLMRGAAMGLDFGKNALSYLSDGPMGTASDLTARGINLMSGKGIGPINYTETVRPALEDLTSGFSEYEAQSTPGQFTSTLGEFAGGAAVMPFGGPVKAMASTIAPAIASETAGQLTEGSEYEGIARLAAALGTPAALSGARTSLQKAALGPDVLMNVPGSARPKAISLLESYDIPMTTGLKTGSEKLRMVEGSLEVPLETKTGLTAAVMKMTGSDKPLATGPALDEIGTRLGAVFDRAENFSGGVPQQNLGASAMNVLDEHMQFAGDDVIPQALTKVANKISGAAETGANLSGKTLQDMRKILRKVMNGKGKDSAVTMKAAQDLNNLVDDFMIETVRARNPKMVPELMQARDQYRAFLTVMETMKRSPGSTSAGGIISPQALSGALRKREGENYLRGTGTDLAKLARAAEEVVSSASAVKAGGERIIAMPKKSDGLLSGGIGAGAGATAALYSGMDPYMIPALASIGGGITGTAQKLAPAALLAAQRSKAGQQYLMPTQNSASTQMLLDTLRSGARQTGGLLNIPQR
tara:strand:- start:326 stop:2143 length:1818 start_codon:yes stop_codon:yes gene_type:complete